MSLLSRHALPIMHVLWDGQTLCPFSRIHGNPWDCDWPEGHIWRGIFYADCLPAHVSCSICAKRLQDDDVRAVLENHEGEVTDVG